MVKRITVLIAFGLLVAACGESRESDLVADPPATVADDGESADGTDDLAPLPTSTLPLPVPDTTGTGGVWHR